MSTSLTPPLSSPRHASVSSIRVLTAVLALLCSPLLFLSNRSAEATSFERMDGTTLYFKNDNGPLKPLKTSIHDIKFLRLLQSSEGGQPYAIFTGRPCSGCAAELAVYLMRVDGSSPPLHFVHPGRVVDPKKKHVLLDSRGFYGKCLPGIDEGYVAFQQERLDRKASLQKNVFIAELGKVMVREKLIERRAPSIKAVQPFLKARTCFELEGRNRLMLKKALDLSPRRGEEGDDENEESETDDIKENQTAQELPSQPE
jgi:hypothetical protein